MDNSIPKLIDEIVLSYNTYRSTGKLDDENILNKQLLIDITYKVRQVLFPGFFDNSCTRSQYIQFLVAEQLEFIQYNLKKQVAKAINDPEGARAEEIVITFLQQIPKLRGLLYTDVQAAYKGDPAAYSTDEIIFSYPGIFATTIYRIAHELFLLKVPMIPRIMTEYAHSLTGIDIHPGATIGQYFFIDHGTGTVIGETTVIGNHVKIYQGVTLGALSTRKGQQLQGTRRHPTIEDEVTIYSGTTILGGETVIGSGAIIGGNAFIVRSVDKGMRVSIKSPELKIRSSEKKQEEFWDWMI